MTIKKRLLTFVGFLCITAILVPLPAIAIDNPDAPDYIGEFNARSKSYIDAGVSTAVLVFTKTKSVVVQ